MFIVASLGPDMQQIYMHCEQQSLVKLLGAHHTLCGAAPRHVSHAGLQALEPCELPLPERSWCGMSLLQDKKVGVLSRAHHIGRQVTGLQCTVSRNSALFAGRKRSHVHGIRSS